MRKVGIVLLVFAIGNLLVAIIASVSGETYAAGSKFSSSLLLGAIGGLKGRCLCRVKEMCKKLYHQWKDGLETLAVKYKK